MNKKIIIFFGPSGAGKSILAKKLKDIGYLEIIGSTTRSPRKGEIPNKDYYFLTKEEFLNTEMIETAEYSGNYYGTQKFEVDNKLQQSDKLFKTLEINGVKAFKEHYRDMVICVYVYASLETLKKRMISRNDPIEKINKRLKNVQETGELDNIYLADYVIINEKTLDESFELLKFMLGEK